MDAEWVNIVLVSVLVGVTTFYAWQTRNQVKSMKKQLDIVVMQRKKSITPVVQLSAIKLEDKIIFIDRNIRIITPNLSIRIKNIGDGPAINISASAKATVLVKYSGEAYHEKLVDMTWETYTQEEKIYLAAHSEATMKLALVRVHASNSTNQVPDISFILECKNMDYEDWKANETLRMHEKLANLIVSEGEYLKPGEDSYPTTIEPRAL